ncbi:hypothetical protein MNAN1_002669 [Malassezia nana]|uniref:histone acetyltransferase n=1 Tax=Malassezia nana TaxID=180528 RepID=A0AAF0J465_9BASI|nr:hypothetical protein MNAN1_002669 [Malassezia nana]
MSLTKVLVRALEKHAPALAESGRLRIQTLFSRPLAVRSLYPLAHVHPTEAPGPPDDFVRVWQEQVLVTAAWEPDGGEERLAYALELYVYTLPEQEAALVYVSKLDTTGYAPRAHTARIRAHLPEPYTHAPSLTSTLTAAAIDYFASRAHWADHSVPVQHVSVHVLARSQSAYLFPSSAEHANKHVLSDAALIRWWHTCLGDTVRACQDKAQVDAFYVIPGYQRLDSHTIVPLHSQTSAQNLWHYGHPYSEKGSGKSAESLPPLPLHAAAWEARRSYMPSSAAMQARTLATLVPVFPDDPKGRYMNELCSTGHEPGFMPRINKDHKPSPEHRQAMMERQALEKVSIEAYWEQMGFRQECSSGNAVGVFVICISAKDACPPAERKAPEAQTFSLPHPLLPNLMLEHLQQDACAWSDVAQAVRLTRHFYEGVHRALRRKGGAHASAEEYDRLGEGLLWAHVPLTAVPGDLVASATVRAGEVPAARGAEAPVHVLSVKRRRRT